MSRRGIAFVVILALTGCSVGGHDGTSTAAAPKPVAVTALTVDSEAVGRRLPMRVVEPRGGGEGRPLVVFLHGRTGNERSELGPPMFRALKAAGNRAPVIAFPYGGRASFWHNRRSGRWGDYVVDEVIPAVEDQFGTDPERIAIGGISMGGYGAYHLNALNRHLFCAVAGHGPAIRQRFVETAPGAFDNARDFKRNGVIAAVRHHPAAFTGKRLWIDAGKRDRFVPGDRVLAAALRHAGADVTVRFPPGAHRQRYWSRHWDDYMRFYANALAGCPN